MTVNSNIFTKRQFDSLAGATRPLPDIHAVSQIELNPVSLDFVLPNIPRTPYALSIYYAELLTEYGVTDAMQKVGRLKWLKKMREEYGFENTVRSLAFHVKYWKRFRLFTVADIYKRTHDFIDTYLPEVNESRPQQGSVEKTGGAVRR